MHAAPSLILLQGTWEEGLHVHVWVLICVRGITIRDTRQDTTSPKLGNKATLRVDGYR
jgi:hypothetical protein